MHLHIDAATWGEGKMTRTIRLAVAAAALALTTLAAQPASADLTLCNQYRQAVYSAYAYHDGVDWTSIGWYTVNPGQCTVLYTGPLQNQFYYLYAYADDGAEWAGDYFFCTHWPNAFQIWGDDECQDGFMEIDTGGATDWTHTLTP